MFIPYGRQTISQKDIDAVCRVLKSDYLTQGDMTERFEAALAEYCRSQYAVLTNNATAALHLACLALGVSSEDIVWTTPISFVASANCALYCGASVDFVDIDPNTYNMSVSALKNKLIQAREANRLPKVVIPVHMTGQSCDMESIHKLSQEFKFSILEDASHAIGGRYKDQPIGSCLYSDIVVFSFHPVKIITTGEGGVALTNNKTLEKKIRLMRSHGITRNPELMTKLPDGPWYYQQLRLGYNYRMTDIQAALGFSQLSSVDIFVRRRHELAKRYDDALGSMALKLPLQTSDTYSSYHLYVIRLCKNDDISRQREIFEYLIDNGVGVNLHYIPIYKQPYYSKFKLNQKAFVESEAYYKSAISLPIYPQLREEQQDIVIDLIKKALKH